MVLQINRAKKDSWLKNCGVLLTAAAFIALMTSGLCRAETSKQRTFASPEEAVKAMVEALKSNDGKSLEAIFGPGSQELIESGDPVEDQTVRKQFLALYGEKNRLEKTADDAVLSVGNDDWPFPIPVVKEDARWRFDTEEGGDEILARRIGRNELSAIQVCLAYVDAQREYALEDRDGDAILEYARKFMSDPGKKNGLYWDVKEGEKQSPLGPLVAMADREGYSYTGRGGKPSPYHGYYYRILKAQGRNAPGGAYDYVVRGNMFGGFSLVAYPAKYESSGIMTFIVNHDGVIYQKDLGPDTEKSAREMTLFDPDTSWKKVDEQHTLAKD